MSRAGHSSGAPALAADQGVVLVWFALLAVGLFGLASLVIDLGFVRLTRTAMVHASDGMALEGMRWRDDAGDSGRRDRARDLLARHFDDNLEVPDRSGPTPVPAPDAIGFGAGPQWGYTGGLGTVVASATLEFARPMRADRVWKPQAAFARNLTNEQSGDLVAGIFVPGVPDIETSDYLRQDFAPSDAAGAPAAPAFLARLRRSPEGEVAGVQSSGPPLNFLYGLGTAIRGEGAYNPRRDGLTLRATAIAGAAPALAVSAVPAGLLSGASGRFAPGEAIALAPFGLLAEGPIATLAPGVPQALTIDADGTLRDGGGVLWGALLQEPARLVGAPVAPISGPPAADLSGAVLAARYGDHGGLRVVSFSLLRVDLVGSSVTLTAQPGTVLPSGASRQVPAALASLAQNPSLAAAHAVASLPVLAPSLLR